jgi:TonB family C-terminal domain
MRIDRYVHAERPTWGAAGVLFLVAGLHATGIGRLLSLEPAPQKVLPPVFEISLQRLPPPKLPQQLERQPPKPNEARADADRQKPKLTRPVPILVDTPTTDPVPPDTQVKQYEIGDELLPGDPGPPMPDGAADGAGQASSGPGLAYQKAVPTHVVEPDYPPQCRRLGIEGNVRVRIVVGTDGRPRNVTLDRSSGEPRLDEAALDAVRLWRFEPARSDGKAVQASMVVPIRFELID